jgi:alanine-glyoxylate transaminase/serine-glyoxylate transaminase/serine-pyruvate transaminase
VTVKTSTGRHVLQIPGPGPVPDRILRAIDMPVIDHRGPAFASLAKGILSDLKTIFRTGDHALIYPSSGTGAWESAIVNALSPKDRVLAFETGHFSTLWSNMARRWGLDVEIVPGDWRHGVDPADVEARLIDDHAHAIKAVMLVHNETSTGILSPVPLVRAAIDRARHPALFMVDAVSSLGAVDYRHDEWSVDVTVSCSQKGLMLPPGLGLVAVSKKALAASRASRFPRSYWNWADMIPAGETGAFPYTPPTNLLYGLRESLDMILEEGLSNVFARHIRLASATRAAVDAWGLELLALNPAEYSPVLTAVVMPAGCNADELRRVALDRFNVSLGAGLSKVAGKVFRIGHLGECDDVSLLGALCAVEMSLRTGSVPHRAGGVQAAMDLLAGAPA